MVVGLVVLTRRGPNKKQAWGQCSHLRHSTQQRPSITESLITSPHDLEAFEDSLGLLLSLEAAVLPVLVGALDLGPCDPLVTLMMQPSV